MSPFEPTSYSPPRLLRHPDVQNIVSSVGPRALALDWRSKAFDAATSVEIVECGNDIRLQGKLTRPQVFGRGLVFLFHGWEGCADSAYMRSAALTLFEAGYTIFRLNFRDHGDSHHLNRGLFNSTLLNEVLDTVRILQQRFRYEKNFLAGYSLGGNFALRTAIASQNHGIQLDHVVAVCPVIDPHHALHALEQGRRIYHDYFVRKWQRSLAKKLQHFPDYNYGQELLQLRSLRQMHDFFVPNYTPYPNRQQYFDAYKIDASQLQNLCVNTTIVSSQDDPITRLEAVLPLAKQTPVQLCVTEYGSHCAFIEDYRFNSWIDHNLVYLFNQY